MGIFLLAINSGHPFSGLLEKTELAKSQIFGELSEIGNIETEKIQE